MRLRRNAASQCSGCNTKSRHREAQFAMPSDLGDGSGVGSTNRSCPHGCRAGHRLITKRGWSKLNSDLTAPAHASIHAPHRQSPHLDHHLSARAHMICGCLVKLRRQGNCLAPMASPAATVDPSGPAQLLAPQAKDKIYLPWPDGRGASSPNRLNATHASSEDQA